MRNIFYQLLFIAEKEHFLDKFTPDEMFVILFWSKVSPLNDDDQLKDELAEFEDKYFEVTGNHVTDYDYIPDGVL